MSDHFNSLKRLLIFFFLALAVHLAYLAWAASGFYFHKPGPGLTLTQEKINNGYGLAAGYGYQEYYGPALDHILNLAHDINTCKIKSLTPQNAGDLLADSHYPNFRHPPGTSLLAWVFHRLTSGPADNYLRIFNILLNSLAAVILVATVQSLLNRRIATLTTLLYIFSLPVLYHTAYMFSPTGSLPFFLISAVAAVIRGLQTSTLRSFAWFALAGLALGISGYFRSDYLIVPIFMLPGIVLVRPKWTFVITRTGLMIAVIMMILFPWAWRNHHLSGRWIFTSAIGPAALYAGLGTSPNPWKLVTSDENLHAEARAAGFTHAWSPQANDYFKQRFRQCVREHPLAWLKSIVYKIPYALATPYYWGFSWPQRQETYLEYNARNLDRFALLRENPLDMLMKFADRAVAAILVFISLIGVVLIIVQKPIARGLLLVFFAPHLCSLVMHTVIYWESRYTVPSLFCWSLGLAWIIYCLTGGKRQWGGALN